jgi:hypothetical protein
VEPCFLVWGGHAYPLPPIPFHLLRALWDKESVSESDVAEEVWGNDDVSQKAIKSALCKLNQCLRKANVPFRYHQKAGYFVKK